MYSGAGCLVALCASGVDAVTLVHTHGVVLNIGSITLLGGLFSVCAKLVPQARLRYLGR